MKRTKVDVGCVAGIAVGPRRGRGGLGRRQALTRSVNRLRLEYDDNIYQEETDKKDSFKIIEEIEFLLNFSLSTVPEYALPPVATYGGRIASRTSSISTRL